MKLPRKAGIPGMITMKTHDGPVESQDPFVLRGFHQLGARREELGLHDQREGSAQRVRRS